MKINYAIKNRMTTFASALGASFLLASLPATAQEAPSHRSIGNIELHMPLSSVKAALLETNPEYVIEEVMRKKTDEVIGYAGVYFNDENDESDVFIAVAGLDGNVLSIARDRLLSEEISKAVLRDSLLEKYGQTPNRESGISDRDSSYSATWFYDQENNSVQKMPRSQFCGTGTITHYIESEARKSIEYLADGRDSCSTFVDTSAVGRGGTEGGVRELRTRVSDQMAIYQDYLRREEMKKAEAEELKAKTAKEGIDL